MPVPPLDIPPEPPPGRTAQAEIMGAEERSRKGVVDRRGHEGEEEVHSVRENEKAVSAEGKCRGSEESQEVMDSPGKKEAVRIQVL